VANLREQPCEILCGGVVGEIPNIEFLRHYCLHTPLLKQKSARRFVARLAHVLGKANLYCHTLPYGRTYYC